MDGDWFDSSVAKCLWPTLCEKKLGNLQIIQVPYIHSNLSYLFHLFILTFTYILFIHFEKKSSWLHPSNTMIDSFLYLCTKYSVLKISWSTVWSIEIVPRGGPPLKMGGLPLEFININLKMGSSGTLKVERTGDHAQHWFKN